MNDRPPIQIYDETAIPLGRQPGGTMPAAQSASCKHNQPKAHWRAKLIVEDIVAIRAALKQGVTQTELAKRYHVTQPAISAIVHGRSWRHVAGYKPPAERYTGKRDSRLIRAMKKHGLIG